jgi:hypothetical protein
VGGEKWRQRQVTPNGLHLKMIPLRCRCYVRQNLAIVVRRRSRSKAVLLLIAHCIECWRAHTVAGGNEDSKEQSRSEIEAIYRPSQHYEPKPRGA